MRFVLEAHDAAALGVVSDNPVEEQHRAAFVAPDEVNEGLLVWLDWL
jgi:hypothetical protein